MKIQAAWTTIQTMVATSLQQTEEKKKEGGIVQELLHAKDTSIPATLLPEIWVSWVLSSQ